MFWLYAVKCETHKKKMEIDFGKKGTEYDYETQFFGFTPESFVDGGS